MAMQPSVDHVLSLVDQLAAEECERLGRWMDFRSWDLALDRFRRGFTEERAAKGLPPPANDEVHEEIDARRTPEELDALRKELRRANHGPWYTWEEVEARLRQSLEESLRKDALAIAEGKPTAAQIFQLIKVLTLEEQCEVRQTIGRRTSPPEKQNPNPD